MDALLKQMRARYSGVRREKTGEAGSITDRRIPPQQTRSFKEKKNWFQRQFSGQKSQDYDSSSGVEYAAKVAAAAFAINTLDEPGSPHQKKEDKIIFTQEAGGVSKRFPGETSLKIPESQDRKVSLTAATTGKRPEKPIGPGPSIKKTPTFAEHLKSTTGIAALEPDMPAIKPIEIQRQSSKRPGIQPADSKRQSSMRSGIPPIDSKRQSSMRSGIPPIDSKRQSSLSSAREETEADAWEKAELAKIKDRYEKLNSTLNSWEEKKKKKARSKLERTEVELDKRRKKAMEDFRSETENIEQIAGGAREKARENRRNEEFKAKEKANILRTTGRVPKTCFCC